ncbi:MAG TPA: zf-HC2 domain-containing protein [Gammaproteobacteria bacterium]|nr:zf-HC2 domain-containing protein [Gammaproteobacteria bacterium]
MHSQQHPEPDQLDRLRAGLLDGQPEEKAALEAHIAGCATCRQRGNWQSLHPGNLGLNLDTDDLQQSLRNARRQALQAGDRHRGNAFVPYATAALLLIAVSIGIWTLQPDHGGQQQIAARDTQVIPDVYEDLEFYLWLANQKENGNANEDADPNNT